MEREHQSQKLNFLGITTINTGTEKLVREIRIHKKLQSQSQMRIKNYTQKLLIAVTNFQIKPTSFVNPSLI